MPTLVTHPWQPRPTQKAASRAFDTCLQHLHPESKQAALTEDQQFDCFAENGLWDWDEVQDLSDVATVRLAASVEARLQ